MSKRKRNDLTLSDKYEVVKQLEKGVKQVEICKQMGISQAQVSRINAKKDVIRQSIEANANSQRKRVRTGKDAEVEKALVEWFKNARQRDIPLSGPILEEKAKHLATQMDKPDFTPTNGWLERWKARNNIVYKKLHGEKKDSDIPAADHWSKTVLPDILQKWNPDDIYNADETGIYYRAIPDGTLAVKSDKVAGSKKSKDRITALLAVNMTGTDKRPLLIIGKSKEPRCFRGVKRLPVTYESNSNAWMTGDLFTKWLKAFNKDMQRQRRKVLLLVDNCSAHPSRSATNLNNVELMFLPPNTTAIIQPCDQGIIRNLKVHYRSRIVRKLIEDIESSTENQLGANQLARKLNLLDAVHALKKAWSAVTTVVNCFKKGGFLIPDNTDMQTDGSNNSTRNTTRNDSYHFRGICGH